MSRKSSMFVGTSLFEKNTMLSVGEISICKQHSHMHRMFKEDCFDALDIAVF